MTPLVLLVGFFGAGKTSLLRKLVPLLKDQGLRPSIILNDYQNARVDALLFRELEAAVTPISGSCVCCGSREELLEAMDAHEHSDDGILLVETNGTTDAEELVTLLAADPRLRDFSLPFQISVVDAKRWQKRFWRCSLEADQVGTASVVYVGHTDEVDEARLEKVLVSLGEKKAPLPPLCLESLVRELVGLSSKCREQGERALCGACDSCGCEHERAHHHHDRSRHHFAAVETALPPLVDRQVFEKALRSLPGEILRAKGLVRFEEAPAVLHIFQKVGQFDGVQTAPLEGEPALDQTLAVFVGSRIDGDFLPKFLEALSPARAG